jgi:hypothetical protein
MFFAAIRSPPFPFVPKFREPKFRELKFPELKFPDPKFARMPTHLSEKIFVRRFVPKLATTFNPKFVRKSSRPSVPMFVLILVKRSARHFALTAG